MWKRILVVTTVLICCAASSVPAQQLSVGDAAPKLQVKEFVRGRPVSRFEKGRLYVVEFWATWCGPCRTSIPHLTELQKKYPNVTFIGVSVWERDQKAVKPFVAQQGEKMAYTVAMDDVPVGARGQEGRMSRDWMRAAGQRGIPTSFVVDRDGKIAWVGHPLRLDRPLEQVAAGTWNLPAASAQFRQEQLRQEKMTRLRGRLIQAQRSRDPKQVLAVLDRAIAEDPSLERMLGPQKFQILASGIKDTPKALAYGSHLVGTVIKDNPMSLNNFAWQIVAPGAPKADARVLKLALQAARRADERVQGRNAAIADTLAKAYFDTGDAARALETQQRAVRLAQGTAIANDAGVKARLEQYQRAVRK